MQPSKIYYERNFPLNQPFLFEKYGMEVTINPGEDPEQAYAYAIEAIHAAHKACHPVIEINTGPETPPIQIQLEKPISEEERMQFIIADIEKCTTIPKPEGIDSYYSLAKQYPSVMAAYEKRKSELVKKETAEILAATEANCLKTPPKKLS